VPADLSQHFQYYCDLRRDNAAPLWGITSPKWKPSFDLKLLAESRTKVLFQQKTPVEKHFAASVARV
jgi:hypothetical protein